MSGLGAERIGLFQNLKNKKILLDVSLVIIVALAGGLFAWHLFDALGEDVLEWRFSVVLTAFPSPVMFAAGHGMNNIDVGAIPELAAFYRTETSHFDPALIPDEYKGFPLSGSYAYMHFYLLYAIGWAWRLFGISFHSIHLLCIFLYMVMIAALYGVFRLGMGRVLSFIGTMIAAASPAYLLSCPSLRDFGKAPFILICFFILGMLLKHRHTRRPLFIYTLFYGLAAGIGYGFRQDLLVCVPAAIVVLLLFVQVEDPRPRLLRFAASAVLLFVFLVVGFPVMYGVRQDNGSASAQAFTQGVSEIVEDRMDFGHASYSMHHHYSDYFDFTVVNNYARRTGYEEPMAGHFSA
ncbi:MAG: glycosyltransferase family 39 protein, partial [Candidatus Hydrogenedentes bacterium]|nr:glycosyltransferase family 39 protein [Candidatus Hydrogenedentota bacterium]